jgi:hypothetical protein
MSKLWHVSETQGIARFEPRAPSSETAGVAVPVVWAIADERLVNYLLPRDCPRVCVRAGLGTTASDRLRYLGTAKATAVIFIEEDWHERAIQAALGLYELPGSTFRCVDENAGYYLSEAAVVPKSETLVRAPLDLMAQRGAELRVVPRLRPVAAEVVASTLAFSVIRLRNAVSAV